MTRCLLKITTCIDAISGWFGRVAGWLCVLLMLLTVEQVVTRHFFDSNSRAVQELEWHLFGAIFLFAGAYTLREDGHVRVDVLYGRLSPRKQALIDVLGTALFLLPVCALIVFYGFNFAVNAMDYVNSHAIDYYSVSCFDKGDKLYEFASFVEAFLRKTVLVGEISPDAGGLEARWLAKMLIPFGFVLMFLQGISLLIRQGLVLFGMTMEEAGEKDVVEVEAEHG